MASSIPSARTSLVAALEALQATTLEGVAVLRSGTAKMLPEHEIITVLNATDIDRDPMLSRGVRFAETFTIPVNVLAIEDGDDIESVETRMWALVTIVEQTVLADATFDRTVIVRSDPAGSDDGERSGAADDRTVYAEITVNIDCEARVTLAA